jgi:hypothetical protein
LAIGTLSDACLMLVMMPPGTTSRNQQRRHLGFNLASELANAKDLTDVRHAQTSMQTYALQAQKLGRLDGGVPKPGAEVATTKLLAHPLLG